MYLQKIFGWPPMESPFGTTSSTASQQAQGIARGDVELQAIAWPRPQMGWNQWGFMVIYPVVIQHNYGKSPYLMGISTINAIFHSYVEFPEGNGNTLCIHNYGKIVGENVKEVDMMLSRQDQYPLVNIQSTMERYTILFMAESIILTGPFSIANCHKWPEGMYSIWFVGTTPRHQRSCGCFWTPPTPTGCLKTKQIMG